MSRLYLLEALDRCFFRGSKPFNAGETQWVASEFPPSPRVMQGMLRSAIGEHLGVDWTEFRNENGHAHNLGNSLDLVQQIGDATSLGKLRLIGPFPHLDNELLFPSPLDLYLGKDNSFGLLQPGTIATSCDLGEVRLPAASEPGIKVMEGRFVTANLMQVLLAGDVSKVQEVTHENGTGKGNLWPLYPPEDKPKAPALADLEPKIGLKRDNTIRRNVDGMLYGIAFARPRNGVRLAIYVSGEGLDERIHPERTSVVRFGGEGKLARLDVCTVTNDMRPTCSQLHNKNGLIRFRLVLATPALMPIGGWLPEGFTQNSGSPTAWNGTVGGVTCTIVSACIGKAVKIGGWDLKNNSPRTLQSLVPAGSVYFCEADASEKTNIEKLHGSHIGSKTEYGFGHMLVGTW